MTPRIARVVAQENQQLRVEFENGEARIFDATPLLDKGYFAELRAPVCFKSVRVIFGGIEWPHE
ncbi:MAG: DUF2442 domain-containing protein [Candidatus Hydrogenedentes bacterium]|nr:DUF2442 domain-containing protein [Candidatus Hydrogenedentota bacterium]